MAACIDTIVPQSSRSIHHRTRSRNPNSSHYEGEKDPNSLYYTQSTGRKSAITATITEISCNIGKRVTTADRRHALDWNVNKNGPYCTNMSHYETFLQLSSQACRETPNRKRKHAIP